MKRIITQVEPNVNEAFQSTYPKTLTGGEDIHCDFLNNLTKMRYKSEERSKNATKISETIDAKKNWN
jgi:hypothetical protein